MTLRAQAFVTPLVFLAFLIPHAAHAEKFDPVITLSKNDEVIGTLSPDIPSLGSLAIGDLGSDGVSEIIAATGYGTPTEIVILRKDGSRIGSFSPYDPAFSGGASVAICDLDGDGVNEIVTGAGFSGGPHVRVFTNLGEATGVQFFAYDEAFRGGVSLLCFDITHDGTPDIITAPGPTGGPHVKVFSSRGDLENELYLDNFPKSTGLTISRSFNAEEFSVTPGAFTEEPEEIRVTCHNGELLTSSPASSASTNTYLITHASAFEKENSYAVEAYATTALSADTSKKYIQVDLSTQTLTAYEYSVPSFSFLVSTGVSSHPTPLGKTEVTAKLPSHDYSWFYGAGNPSNYSLPNVLWNLRFRDHYYIHSAYWHHNFGHVMSHGCVNTSIPDGEKVFNWAEVGTPVEIVE